MCGLTTQDLDLPVYSKAVLSQQIGRVKLGVSLADPPAQGYHIKA